MVFVVVIHANRAYVVKPGDGLEEVKRYFGLQKKDVRLEGRDGVVVGKCNGETGLVALEKMGGLVDWHLKVVVKRSARRKKVVVGEMESVVAEPGLDLDVVELTVDSDLAEPAVDLDVVEPAVHSDVAEPRVDSDVVEPGVESVVETEVVSESSTKMYQNVQSLKVQYCTHFEAFTRIT